MMKKHYMHITEEMLKENSNLCDYNASSLNFRQLILASEVSKLGKEAALKAIEEWGQSKSKITHVLFCTNSGVDIPGADYQLIKLLGLHSSVKRLILCQEGCHSGAMVLRIAKDMAENNRGARVLVVCSESTVICFRGPTDAHMDSMVAQALFGDGAAAMIVGADPDESIERPIFKLVWTAQAILPDSEGAIEGHIREAGMDIRLSSDVPKLISNSIKNALVEAFDPIGLEINDRNSFFWIAHPGGPAILDKVEAELGLEENKLSTTRHVLSEFGNMWSACMIFILDEMRKRSLKECKTTTGEGLDWGVMVGLGPGITVETIVIHSVPLS